MIDCVARSTDLDMAPKKYANAGLRNVKSAKAAEIVQVDAFESGGLNDEDASSTRPDFLYQAREESSNVRSWSIPQNLKRDPSRRNEVSPWWYDSTIL